uniref:Uncharacterized protein n=1 Tax=Rhizobium meliloti TaxID=382 RepID=I2E1E4_RHIML|nr:short hypothetical protein [Sinorhizobium meliloti]
MLVIKTDELDRPAWMLRRGLPWKIVELTRGTRTNPIYSMPR